MIETQGFQPEQETTKELPLRPFRSLRWMFLATLLALPFAKESHQNGGSEVQENEEDNDADFEEIPARTYEIHSPKLRKGERLI